jgi:hypothetical protein
MTTTGYRVGPDVGGSTMKAGVVNDTGRQLAGVVLPTEPQRAHPFGLERMCETIRVKGPEHLSGNQAREPDCAVRSPSFPRSPRKPGGEAVGGLIG